jgi:hypothetical protein
VNGAADRVTGQGAWRAGPGRVTQAVLNNHSIPGGALAALHGNRMSLPLDKLMNPQSVAIVGVSARPEINPLIVGPRGAKGVDVLFEPVGGPASEQHP